MDNTEQEEIIIRTMLEACKTQLECKDWIASQIQTSYTKAESMRAHNPQATQAHYTDIRAYARLRFYLDELTNHLPA